MRILVLCSANRCRSPMAAALLQRHLDQLGVEATVRSAGTSAVVCRDGEPIAEGSEDALARLGIDASAHRSRAVSAEVVESADLILAMAREHLREAVAIAPGAWRRAFTLKELVRLGTTGGPRRPDEALGTWLTVLGGARAPKDLLGGAAEDDIEDPMGGPPSAHVRTADELDRLTAKTAQLIAGAPPAT